MMLPEVVDVPGLPLLEGTQPLSVLLGIPA